MKLSAEQITERDGYVDELNKLTDEIHGQENAVNEQVGKLNELIQRYNNVLINVEGFTETIASGIEDFVAEKSEKWQESEASDACYSMRDDWESLDTSKISTIEPIEVQALDCADYLSNLPEKPEQ